MMTKPGIYMHYKKKLYNVIGTVTHRTTNQSLTLYNSMYDKKQSWLRPTEMFQEKIIIDDKLTERFTFITECFYDCTSEQNYLKKVKELGCESKDPLKNYNERKLTLNTNSTSVIKYSEFGPRAFPDTYKIHGFATHTEDQEDYVIYSLIDESCDSSGKQDFNWYAEKIFK